MAKPRRLLCCALPSVKMPEKLTQLQERLSFKGRRAGRASSSEGQPSFTNLDDEQKHAQQKQGGLGLTARKARINVPRVCSWQPFRPPLRCLTTHLRQAWEARPLWHDRCRS